MRKNLAVDVPRDAETEVDRIRGLKKSIFTRTRIATLCLVMVVALSVTGTLAFEKYSGNATPNRGTMNFVGIKIGENASGGSSYSYLNEQNYSFGQNSKHVRIEVSSTIKDDPDLSYDVSVSFVPEIDSLGYKDTSDNTISGGNLAFTEDWMLGVQTNSSGRQYINTSIMTLWLASGWENDWTYEGGIFKSKEPFKVSEGAYKSKELLSGVTLGSEIDTADYGKFRVRIIAQATQHVDEETEEEETA